MNSKIDIGKKVWSIRKEILKKTQEEFAEIIDTTPETIGNLERSVVYPSLRTIARIAECCGHSVDDILGIKQ